MTRIYNKLYQKEKRRLLRNFSTKAEIILWRHLKNKQLGFKFRRQYGIGPYVVDFYCPAKRIVIEVDGESHFKQGTKEYDKQRQSEIETLGIKLIRFTNNDIYRNIEKVIEIIKKLVNHNYEQNL